MPAVLDNDVAIETPEHIVFRHRVAGPARRMVAYAIDFAICYGAVAAITAVLVLGTVGASAWGDAVDGTIQAGLGVWLVLLFLAQWVYFVALEATRGTTPGKRALGLRVITTEGRPIGFPAAALRNILRAADILPTAYVTGLVTMACTARFQRLGDLVAGTMVVIEQHTRPEAAIVLEPPASPREIEGLPSDVSFDADERTAIEMFLRRRDKLGAAREQELAEIVIGPLSRRYGLRVADPVRTLAVLYDQVANAGRSDPPPSLPPPNV
jgi:uncharacterized RDD family membrane protein YckC